MPAAPAGSLRLILGEEELLVARAVQQVASAARSADPQADVREIPAAEMVAGDLHELLSPSLFGDRRTVIVARAQEAIKEVADALAAYAADPAEEVTLAVSHSGAARNRKLVDALRAAGAAVTTCARLTRTEDRLAFVRDEFARAGAAVTPDAARLLLDAVGTDLRELASACTQLAADTPGTVDEVAVARYHRGRAGVTGFAVSDATVVGDVAGALEALQWARSLGVDPVPIADALADGVRTVARVAAARRGSAADVASALGLPLWKVRRAQGQARGWHPAGLTRAMQLAAQLNGEVKGTAVDADYALQRAVLGIAAARELRSLPR